MAKPTNPWAKLMETTRRRELGVGALYGPVGHENVILKMESPELSTRRKIILEAMEQDVRYASFYQNLQFQIAVQEDQRQARDTVSQVVQESSGSYKVMMMQEIQGIQSRCEGRIEEYERIVAQVSDSEARDAARGQKKHMLQEHQSRF